MNLKWKKKGKDQDTLKLDFYSTGRQLFRGGNFLPKPGKAVYSVGRCVAESISASTPQMF